jgi:hypothetical protein
MPARHWDELSINDKVDELRQEFDAARANETRNIQARTDRFAKIEKRLGEVEEVLKKIQSRLDRLERRNLCA